MTFPLLACDGADGGVRGMSGHLVIAFSLLGNSLVWQEFDRSLTLVNHERTRRSVQAVDKCNDHCHACDKDNNDDSNNNGAFDVLFAANPTQL